MIGQRNPGEMHQRWQPQNSYNIILEMPSHPFFHILLVTNTNSGTTWEVTTQGCENQQAGIIVGYFGGWLASYFTTRGGKKQLYIQRFIIKHLI